MGVILAEVTKGIGASGTGPCLIRDKSTMSTTAQWVNKRKCFDSCRKSLNERATGKRNFADSQWF